MEHGDNVIIMHKRAYSAGLSDSVQIELARNVLTIGTGLLDRPVALDVVRRRRLVAITVQIRLLVG